MTKTIYLANDAQVGSLRKGIEKLIDQNRTRQVTERHKTDAILNGESIDCRYNQEVERKQRNHPHTSLIDHVISANCDHQSSEKVSWKKADLLPTAGVSGLYMGLHASFPYESGWHENSGGNCESTAIHKSVTNEELDWTGNGKLSNNPITNQFFLITLQSKATKSKQVSYIFTLTFSFSAFLLSIFRTSLYDTELLWGSLIICQLYIWVW